MIENLNKEQLEEILETMPIEISFVDEDDLVKFWNKHKTRIFKRPVSVIGKSVQNCHPQRSVDKVNQILSDFKSGKGDSAEFWINLMERNVYIRYFAVRDKAGKYLGTLEATQDITEVKNPTASCGALRGRETPHTGLRTWPLSSPQQAGGYSAETFIKKIKGEKRLLYESKE